MAISLVYGEACHSPLKVMKRYWRAAQLAMQDVPHSGAPLAASHHAISAALEELHHVCVVCSSWAATQGSAGPSIPHHLPCMHR